LKRTKSTVCTNQVKTKSFLLFPNINPDPIVRVICGAKLVRGDRNAFLHKGSGEDVAKDGYVR
jgi:hypothetical protein